MEESGGNVSRSGRVRKKPTKLAGFQSPDDLDAAQKRGGTKRGAGDELNFSGQMFEGEDDGDLLELNDQDLNMDIENLDLDKLEDWMSFEGLEEEDMLAGGDNAVSAGSPARTEIVKKPANLPLLQDAGVSGRSAQHTTKVAAFLLWARHVRPQVVQQNPGIGPSHLGVRLGELWNGVPKTEKQAWNEKAKRLTSGLSRSPVKNFIVQGGATSASGGMKGVGSSTAQNAGASSGMITRIQGSDQIASATGLGRPVEPIGLPSTYRSGGTAPVNVAAHLRLLGESLQVIGERLTEHNGVIAVSGSLSVLLDSMLCAMGPLLCLTQRVPELNGADPAVLNNILDNVAYIMPGL